MDLRKWCIETLKFAYDSPETSATFSAISPDSDPNITVTFQMIIDVPMTAAAGVSIMDDMNEHHENRELDKYLDSRRDRSVRS
ncbi:hypothetical protein X768_16745 [Mesorhizobium sp. LSJC265A00]|nr:hypothetical protein X768_16745 [Mesorhizobium sp. LSJC265A00]